MSPPYTAITFAPVQGFIQKSRKLRDLYGGSFILSHLAESICQEIGENNIISPALINTTQGVPNQIIAKGDYTNSQLRDRLQTSWGNILKHCRQWIETELKDEYRFEWERPWKLYEKHTWEFFIATGDSITDARGAVNELKRQRDWTAINWKGESSTLSGFDGIAWHGMDRNIKPQSRILSQEDREIRDFYDSLGEKLGESFVTGKEQLSIPELVKRLITYKQVIDKIPEIKSKDIPRSFSDLKFWQDEEKENAKIPQQKISHRGWFCGDGDQAGDYLKRLSAKSKDNPDQIDKETKSFSLSMREWGRELQQTFRNGRIIYAGGDDFLGVFNRTQSELKAQECLNWFYQFRDREWQKGGKKPITVSVGFVWAAKNVPQRDVLQHCREAEKSAKSNGRDRLALRVLFSGGNYLEWVCPWWMLEDVLEAYSDRSGGKNWTHIYNDIATLESRHAFDNQQTKVSLALFDLYFGAENCQKMTANKWNSETNSGILGKESNYFQHGINQLDQARVNAAINNWIINLAKIGFHLCSST